MGDKNECEKYIKTIQSGGCCWGILCEDEENTIILNYTFPRWRNDQSMKYMKLKDIQTDGNSVVYFSKAMRDRDQQTFIETFFR